MKSFVVGLVTVLVIGLAGFAVFRNGQNLLSRLTTSPSPSPTPSTLPIESPQATREMTPDAKRSGSPAPTYKPTTKGGVVKGTNTTTPISITTSTSRLFLTLVKSSTCPISYMTEVKDITGPLTLKYALKDGFSARLNVWRKDGNELVPNTTVSGSGTLATISGVDYFKIRIESADCGGDDTDWVKITAER